jgi:hypothetical protein
MDNDIIVKIKKRIRDIQIKQKTIKILLGIILSIIELSYNNKTDIEKKTLTITILEELVRESNISNIERKKCMKEINNIFVDLTNNFI